MDFDDAHRQSILHNIKLSRGVSLFLHYDQPIDEKTRVLCYSYRSKEEGITFNRCKKQKIIPLPSLN